MNSSSIEDDNQHKHATLLNLFSCPGVQLFAYFTNFAIAGRQEEPSDAMDSFVRCHDSQCNLGWQVSM